MMASFNSFSQEKNLYNTIYSELKALGVKVPKPKKIRSCASKLEVFVSESSCKIFGVSLRDQEWITNGDYPIPKFVAFTTEYLQKFSHQEGLFRKGGNVVRQRRLKAQIEKGNDIQDSDPNDVATLLKQWLRELPEPLIPAHLQELFIRCHNLETEKDRETAYLFAFLLLPIDHQHTLKHLMRFFANLALDSDQNKMGTYNLALILAPNIFALPETVDKARNNLIFKHTAIIQILIENSDRVGRMPPLSSSFLYQTALLGSELTSSVDVLDMGPGKYKRRMSGTVQDLFSGFKRLVGQNVSFKATSEINLTETSGPRLASKRKAEPEHSASPKRKKPSVSLDDLDSSTFVTPENKARTIPEKSSSRHARRKSFGALFLRKKEKKSTKSTPNLQMKVVDISLDTHVQEQNESNSASVGSKCKLNLNFTQSFPIIEKEPSIESPETTEQVASRPAAPSRSDSKTVVKKVETTKFLVENVAESIKTSSSVESTACGKTSKVEMTTTHKSGLSRQEAFSIRPPKNRFQSTVSERKSEKDTKPDDLNEKVKKDTPTKTQDNTCTQSQSSCSSKCGKNKSVCERKTTQGKTKRETVNKRRPQSLKMPRYNECTDDGSPQSQRVNSHQNLAGNCSTSDSPKDSPTSAASVSQSLDLSLNLLLQNFCVSPPIDTPDFRLSIDISSDKKNSGLKVNISQKEKQPKNSNESDKNEASESKPRKRLSSSSESRIPRLKKIPNQNRPSSFHGNHASSNRRDQKVELNEKTYGRHSTKIPSLKLNGMSPSTPRRRLDTDDQSPSDSCFKTPDTTFGHDASITWTNGSHYLSALASPDNSVANKRESIMKILKYNPGHVLSKVNMFDSKGSSSSESDCKLKRTSSEKYSSVSRCTRPKLAVSKSKSYNAVGRSDTVRYRMTPHKHERPVPRRVSFKASDTPYKRSLTKNIEENTVPEETSGDSSNDHQPESGNKK